MDESKDTSRFDGGQEAPTPAPVFRGPRASNTVETLRPRDISWPTATLPSPGYAGAPADVPPELDPFKTYDPVRPLQGRGLPPEGFNLTPVQKTDLFTGLEHPEKLNANILPVNWPASTNKPPQLPLTDRVERLEEQLDALKDRIAKFNFKASHKL